MLNLKKYLITGALVVSSWCSVALNAECIEPWNSLSVSGGWSHDDLKSKTRRDVSGESDFTRHTNVDGINIWKVGADLNLAIPSFGCGCDDWWWLNNFYLRGYAYRGWVTSGKLHHKGNGDESFSLSAKSHKGRTVNGLIGLGFLFPVCDDFAIGPVGGWSYDQVRVSLKHRHNSGSSDNSYSNPNRFTSTWRGPWVGADFAWNLCLCDCWSFRFVGGYEYHWAHWKGSLSFGDNSGSSSSSGFGSDHRHAKKAHGQVGYVTGWWNVCDCWDVGLGLKYKYYTSNNGKVHRSVEGSDSSARDRLKNNSWRSIGLTLDLAYRF